MTLCVEIRSRRRRCVETRSRRRRVRVDFNADHDVPSREIRKHDDRRVVHVAQAVHGDGPALVPARAPRSPRSRRAEDRPPSSRSPRSRRTVPMFPLAAVPTRRGPPRLPARRGPGAPRTSPSPRSPRSRRAADRPDSRRGTVPNVGRGDAATHPRTIQVVAAAPRLGPKRLGAAATRSEMPRRTPERYEIVAGAFARSGGARAARASSPKSRRTHMCPPRARTRRRVAAPRELAEELARAAAVAAAD